MPRAFSIPSIAIACIALLTGGCASSSYKITDRTAIRIPLDRSNEHKLLLRATAAGGPAWVELDTGAPITCADETKAALFNFQPFPPGSQPPTLILNGKPHKMTVIPQLEFGGVTVKNFPVALIDLSNMNQSLLRNRDRTNDAILGLDALRTLHAVIDCGTRKLFLNPNPAASAAATFTADGWRAVPMRLIGQHPVVPVVVNGEPALFLVDTGAPFSAIDAAWCRRQGIPLRGQNFTMKAIHYETTAAQVAHIHDLKVGPLDLGQTIVGVFDLGTLVGNGGIASTPVTGLIGSQTLERLQAIIDCGAMQLYIRQPDSIGGLNF
jgi:predicted aspartyl protease